MIRGILKIEMLRIGVLLRHPVDPAHDAQVVRIDLIGGHDPRTEGATRVQAFALQILPTMSPLHVAGGDVIQHGVSKTEVGALEMKWGWAGSVWSLWCSPCVSA